MEVDDGEGAAGDASDVMQGAIEVRWARIEDKKGYAKVSLGLADVDLLVIRDWTAGGVIERVEAVGRSTRRVFAREGSSTRVELNSFETNQAHFRIFCFLHQGTASNFYRKNGHQAGKPQIYDDHPSSSSRPGRATHTSIWAHDLHDDNSSSSSSFNAHGLPSRPSYPRDPETPYDGRPPREDLGIDLLAPSFSLERPSHYRGDDDDDDDSRRRGTTIRGKSRRSASPPNLSAPGESSTRRAASFLKRFAGRSRSRSPPSNSLSHRIAKVPLDERVGIKLSASGDLLGEDDLPSGGGGGGMRIDGPPRDVDLMDAIGGGKGAGMMIDREYVQQGARPSRQSSSSFGKGVYEREGGGGAGRESFGRREEGRGGDDRDRRGGDYRRDDRRNNRRDDRGGGGGGGGRRGEARAEDLDKELEEFLTKR